MFRDIKNMNSPHGRETAVIPAAYRARRAYPRAHSNFPLSQGQYIFLALNWLYVRLRLSPFHTERVMK